MALREVELIPDGALVIQNGQIVAVGTTPEIRAAYTSVNIINAAGRAVIPGLVDCHTHLIYGGDRLNDFEMRLAGAQYLDILAAGGGILSTVRATRAADLDSLIWAGRACLDAMLSQGTTTAEVKTGYGLDLETELKMLGAIASLDQTHPVGLVPTFLGAHAVPPELNGDADAYIHYLLTIVLPAAVRWYGDSHFARKHIPFSVDVFCENHAFTVEQSRVMLAAGQALGLKIHAHVDQFTALGGLEMAVSLGAASVDHLEATTPAGVDALAKSETVAVLLPACSYHLGSAYPPARALIDAGAIVALASDHNPGSSPTVGLPFVMGLACRQMKLSPAESLNAVTINAAHALGIADRVGSLAAGKSADFVILDSPDWRVLPYQIGAAPIAEVYKYGARVG
jgi:imidazolonepropionase